MELQLDPNELRNKFNIPDDKDINYIMDCYAGKHLESYIYSKFDLFTVELKEYFNNKNAYIDQHNIDNVKDYFYPLFKLDLNNYLLVKHLLDENNESILSKRNLKRLNKAFKKMNKFVISHFNWLYNMNESQFTNEDIDHYNNFFRGYEIIYYYESYILPLLVKDANQAMLYLTFDFNNYNGSTQNDTLHKSLLENIYQRMYYIRVNKNISQNDKEMLYNLQYLLYVNKMGTPIDLKMFYAIQGKRK